MIVELRNGFVGELIWLVSNDIEDVIYGKNCNADLGDEVRRVLISSQKEEPRGITRGRSEAKEGEPLPSDSTAR